MEQPGTSALIMGGWLCRCWFNPLCHDANPQNFILIPSTCEFMHRGLLYPNPGL